MSDNHNNHFAGRSERAPGAYDVDAAMMGESFNAVIAVETAPRFLAWLHATGYSIAEAKHRSGEYLNWVIERAQRFYDEYAVAVTLEYDARRRMMNSYLWRIANRERAERRVYPEVIH